MINHIKTISTGNTDNILNIKTNIKKGIIKFNIPGANSNKSELIHQKLKNTFNYLRLKFPPSNTNILISPTDNINISSEIELAIALSILDYQNEINIDDDYIILGQFGLNDNLLPLENPYRYMKLFLESDIKNIIIPFGNYNFDYIKYKNIYYADNLKDVILHFKYNKTLLTQSRYAYKETSYSYTINDILDQKELIRALIIAIAGNHSIFIKGPIGSGKTFSIKTLLSILPKLNDYELISLNDINLRYNSNSKYTNLPNLNFIHPSISLNQFNGTKNKIGYIAKSNYSVMVLDEINTFSVSFLDNLKILMDKKLSGEISNDILKQPINYTIIGIMNPCPCGNYGTNRKCTCSINMINNFNKKINKSLLDRFEIKININIPNKYVEISDNNKYDLEKIRNCISIARKKQNKRYKSNQLYNGSLDSIKIRKNIFLDKTCINYLEKIKEKKDLSIRNIDNIIKVSRTIADLENEENILKKHIYEAIRYTNFR